MLANRFKYFYFGFLTAIFALTILSVYIFKQNSLLMNISLVDDYDKTHIYDKFDDNEKIKLILPVEILKNEIMFEDDIKKTMNYIATVVDGRYVPNPNLTAFQKLSHILTQNGGGFVETWL